MPWTKKCTPIFSFLRYVKNSASSTSSSSTLTEASGGAILNFLVEYRTNPETIDAAQRELRRMFENDEIQLMNPVIFDKARYSLVSSILKGEDENQWVEWASGNAPVLEGNRLALSFELSPERTQLMYKSLQSSTPDLSMIFELSFSGLSDAFEAEMDIKWNEVRTHESMEAGGNVYFVSAQAKAAIDKMLQDQTIMLRASGQDQNMEALIQSIYDRLISLFFKPVEPAPSGR